MINTVCPPVKSRKSPINFYNTIQKNYKSITITKHYSNILV